MSYIMAAEGGPVDREDTQEISLQLICFPFGPKDEARKVCLAVEAFPFV